MRHIETQRALEPPGRPERGALTPKDLGVALDEVVQALTRPQERVNSRLKAAALVAGLVRLAWRFSGDKPATVGEVQDRAR